MTSRTLASTRSRDNGSKVSLFISPTYIFALLVLLLNDFVLKHSWPGFVTGKLSDFAGLFALAIFLLVLTRRDVSLFVLALSFVFWKSPFSDVMIRVWSSATGFAIGRTVDATDLAALIVLPLALLVYRAAKARKIGQGWYCALSLSVSVFAFTATSRAPTPQERAAFHAAVAEFVFTDDQPSYRFSFDRKNLYLAFEAHGFSVSGSTAIYPNPGQHSAGLIPRRSLSLRDRSGVPELFAAEFDVDNRATGVTLRITKISITRAGQSISRADAVRIFETSVVAPLQKNGASRPPRSDSAMETSNHAMQPTPGRRTTKISMTPTSHSAATRALASGGSSCSR